MESGIYVIQNTANGKRYVGSAIRFGARWLDHKFRLRRGTHPNIHLQRSFNLHGEAAFEFKAIEECPKDALLEREQHWLDTSKPEYNICKTAGSRLGMRHSLETLAKMSAAKIGKKHSSQHRAKISESNAGRSFSPEHRAKLSAAKIGKVGRKHSAETRARISASRRKAATC